MTGKGQGDTTTERINEPYKVRNYQVYIYSIYTKRVCIWGHMLDLNLVFKF